MSLKKFFVSYSDFRSLSDYFEDPPDLEPPQ